jgi:cysteine desulfurase
MNRPAIYLDHNASTPLLPEAGAAVAEALALSGTPSSVHGHGRALRNVIEAARDRVAAMAGATRQQVVFTSSGTEAITQAIVGGAKALGIDGIVVGAGEHAAVLKAAEATGLPATTIGLTADGVVDVDALATGLGAAQGTVLVAVQAINNETGVVQPLARISALVGPTRHFLFVDAVQALGRIPLDFAASAPDMMAVSAHKIGGPAGVGALLVKAHAEAARLIPGGGQEQNRRGGTEPAALIAGFGAAAEAFGRRYDADRVQALTMKLEAGLLAMASDAVVFGAGAQRAGNVVNFAVPGLGSAAAMMGLDLIGLSVSSGSACSSGKVGTSHVLAAMGVPAELAGCALRVSLGWDSTDEDVEAFLSGFAQVLERHRERRNKAA